MGEVTTTEVPAETVTAEEKTPDLSGILGNTDFTFPAVTEPEGIPSETEVSTEPEVTTAPTEQAQETEPVQESETTAHVADETQEPEAATAIIEVPERPTVSVAGYAIDITWLYGALALLVVLLVAVITDSMRKRKKRKNAAPVHDHATVDAVAHASGNVGVKVAVLQAQGARKDQQDSYGVSDLSDPSTYAQQGMMAVVADGMGGLANGGMVSNLLVRVFQQGFQNGGAYMQPQDLLLDLAMRANVQVNQMLQGAERSGSTLVATTIRSGYLHFLTVGDSHLYLYRSGVLLQLNREHVYKEELAVKAVNRYVSATQVHSDPQAHSLTSYFGIGVIPSIDRSVDGIKLVAGDRIILCSDGVYGTLTQEQMEQALCKPLEEAAKIMGDMIEEAAKPHQDNYTAVILEYRD